jgi:ubiquinone/menaquinone biosynthesis C-methylase UbiE
MQGNHMSYSYPDQLDFVTLALVCQDGVDDQLLNRIEDDVYACAKRLFASNDFDSLLDLGCGQGRLIIKFSDYFQKVTGLEPDKHRIEAAKLNVAEQNINHVEFINALFQDAGFPDNHFDAVICNQVLQHVNTATVDEIINEVYRVLKKDGVFVLSVSGTETDKEYFKKAFLVNDTGHSTEVNQEEFNRLTNDQNGILPIRFFLAENIRNYLSRFTLLEQLSHTEFYPHPTLLFIAKK